MYPIHPPPPPPHIAQLPRLRVMVLTYGSSAERTFPQLLTACPALEVLKLRGNRPFLSGKEGVTDGMLASVSSPPYRSA